LSGSFLMKN